MFVLYLPGSITIIETSTVLRCPGVSHDRLEARRPSVVTHDGTVQRSQLRVIPRDTAADVLGLGDLALKDAAGLGVVLEDLHPGVLSFEPAISEE